MRALRLKTVVTLLLMFVVSSAYGFNMDLLVGNAPWIIKAKDKTILCTSLARMNMFGLAATQNDKVAVMQSLKEGIENGEIELIQPGTEVYFVKRTSKKVIQVRPVGTNELYYTVSDSFDEGHSAEGGSK